FSSVKWRRVVLVGLLVTANVAFFWWIIRLRQSFSELGEAVTTAADAVFAATSRLEQVDTLLPIGSAVILDERVVAQLRGLARIRERQTDDQLDSSANSRWQTLLALARSQQASLSSATPASISLPSSAMPNSESDIPLANDSAGASPGLLGLLARDEPGVVYVASLD